MRRIPQTLAFVLSLWFVGMPLYAATPVLAADQDGRADASTARLWLPSLTSDYYNLTVDPQNRQESLSFYKTYYLPFNDIDPAWTGSPATCDAGTTSPVFREAVRMRINYFRAMAGLPADIGLSDEYNRKAQQAALMMSVNEELHHSPPQNWTCYTEDGAEAAGHSNLFLGVSGVESVTGYIEDPGDNNSAVGHRRWILCPQSQVMGTGDIPGTDDWSRWAANALWVIDGHTWDPRPPTRDSFVAWPPQGYVPGPLVFPRWSFSYADADFTQARVRMTSGGADVPVTIEPLVCGYCENTLVWRPVVDWSSLDLSQDCAFTVTVRDVLLSGQMRNFTYTVTLFDPN